MIKPGTLCIIIRADVYPDLLGRMCTVESVGNYVSRQGTQCDCLIEIPDFIEPKTGLNRFICPFSWLLPIQPDAITQFEAEEHYA